jgi:MFS transporter, AAHS family, 3-hydroxyphenylpropionic acid transporter
MNLIEERDATGARAAIFVCFLVALFEGLDIQSMGVAAPRLALAFGFGPGQMGPVMSASPLGLAIGAALGGWSSDRIGRKAVILFSMAALALFSLATTLAPGYAALIAIRVAAGLGLGGAFPNLIAMVSEVAPARTRVTALALMYCGMPLGGIAAAAIAGWGSHADWRPVFFVGGMGPLILIPVLAKWLPGRAWLRNFQGDAGSLPGTGGRIDSLFGARSGSTLLLWASYFFTLLVVYLLLNWLPSLMIAKGYSHTQAAASSIALNIGAVIGSVLLGRMSDRCLPRTTLGCTYMGMVASLIVLALGRGDALFLGAFLAGFFVIGGQLVLYAIAPTIYPQRLRGTGVGAAVAVGRIGSILGPLLAGLLLSIGFAPRAVPIAATPGLLIAFAAAIMLVSRDLRSGA